MTVAPDQRHLNIVGTLHGGFLMAIVDHALFAGPMALGIEDAAGGVTIDASVQFLAPAKDGRTLEAVVDVLRETRRMIFMRGLIEQDRSEEHTSELQSLIRISYAVFCLNKKNYQSFIHFF